MYVKMPQLFWDTKGPNPMGQVSCGQDHKIVVFERKTWFKSLKTRWGGEAKRFQDLCNFA